MKSFKSAFISIFVTVSFFTQSSAAKPVLQKTVTDSVIKIKEDEDGKLIVLSQSKTIFYLKFKNRWFDSNFEKLNKSRLNSSRLKILTDSQFNILKVDLL